MKRDLDYQYQQWQEQINSWIYNRGDVIECCRIKNSFDFDIESHRDCLEFAVLDSNELEEHKQEYKLLIEELEQFQNELNFKFENFSGYVERRYYEIRRRVYGTNDEEQQGLTAQRIQQFEQFQADESVVDHQCAICMGDIEAGRNMMRLDCDGKHIFCQVCIEGWFADHNTCPVCRHQF